MNKLTFTIVLLMVLFPVFFAGAQVRDAGLWMSVEAEKKISRAFSVSLEAELRMNENITEAGTLIGDIGFRYRLGSHFRAGAGYRYGSSRRVDDSYDSRHRYYFDLTYRTRFGRLIMEARGRFQSQYTDISTSENGRVPENMFIPRLEFSYNLPGKLEPYVYTETRFRLNRIVYGSFVQLRVCAGLSYKFTRMHAVDLYYLIRKDYNVKTPETDYILGVGYHFTF